MTYEFVIGSGRDDGKLVFGLKENLRWIEEKRYGLEVNNFYDTEQGLYKIEVVMRDSAVAGSWVFEDALKVLKHLLAENLAEYILAESKEQLIWEEINKRYKKFTPKSKRNIFNETLYIIDNTEQSGGVALLLNYGRKRRITENIAAYMQTNNYINLEGYIRFCMRDFAAEIKRAAYAAHREFTGKTEYYEFINLLYYFAEQRIPEINEINLLITGKNKFYIWNSRGQEIKEELPGRPDSAGALVRLLITVAPRRIVIHHAANAVNNQLTEVIRDIFAGRVSECTGCKKCLDYQNHSLVPEDK
jgi:putative sporulation protein YtxC